MDTSSLRKLFERRKERPLSLTEFPNGLVVSFFLLSLKELDLLFKIKETFFLSNEDFYELIYDLTIHEESRPLIDDREHAGISVSVAQAVLKQSNPDIEEIKNKVFHFRKKAEGNILDLFKTTIIVAFPAYKIEELEDYYIDDLIALFSKAEESLAQRNPNYQKISFQDNKRTVSKINFEEENKALNKMGVK